MKKSESIQNYKKQYFMTNINKFLKKEWNYFWTWKYNHYTQNDCIYPLRTYNSTDNNQLTLLIHNVLYHINYINGLIKQSELLYN